MFNKKKRTRILIIKLGAIGDVVMALPLISAINKKYPGVEITWIGGKIVVPILRSVEGINNIITIDDALLFKGTLAEKFSVLTKVWLALFGKRYDLVLIPYRDRRYKLLALTTLKKKCRTLNGKDRNSSIIPGRYHAVEYTKLVTGYDDFNLSNVVFPKVKLKSDADINSLFNGKAKYVALAPGGAKNLLNEDSLRNWPIENYKRIAELLLAAGIKVFILGAKSDEWASPYFKNLDLVNLIGKTSMPQLMSVLEKVNLLISHDTGILHLGKLFNVPTVALFGPVNPIERVGKNENIDVIWEAESLACAPCYDGKKFANCENNLCMKNISVEIAFDKINNLLKL